MMAAGGADRVRHSDNGAAAARARRRDVASRVVAAIAGGYLAAAMVTAVLARSLPLLRADATTLAMLLSFFVYAGFVLAVFGASTTRRAWWIVLAPALACGALLLVLGGSA
jgi:hypothetical protein